MAGQAGRCPRIAANPRGGNAPWPARAVGANNVNDAARWNNRAGLLECLERAYSPAASIASPVVGSPDVSRMSTRWFNVLVGAFWLATMCWLIVAKVLPPLLRGDPPNYQTMLPQAGEKPPEPVVWRMFWGERPIGRAESTVERRMDGMIDLATHVEIAGLPLAEVAPTWLAPFLRQLGPGQAELNLEADSSFAIDPLGRLVGFHSSLGLADQRDAITLEGIVEDGRLKVITRYDRFVQDSEMFLSSDALVGNALSPQQRLPGLRIGQTWTVPVFSPFRTPDSPAEILQATVERDEWIVHEGQTLDARLVIYRSDPGAGPQALHRIRGKLWVHPDGTVLKQELMVLDSRLTFVRETPREAAAP